MSIFKRKIKNTFDVARDMGVDEEKIKELKEGERQVEGVTMDKVLQAVNKSQVERNIEKLNIFEWYINTDLKALRKEFGYKNAVALAEVLKIENSGISRAENKKYNRVSVYTTSKQPRYLANKKWKTRVISTHGLDPNSKEGLKMKDIAMTNDARKGLAVILENGGAGATRNNVRRLIDQNKDVKVFMLTSNSGDQYVKNILEELDKGG